MPDDIVQEFKKIIDRGMQWVKDKPVVIIGKGKKESRNIYLYLAVQARNYVPSKHVERMYLDLSHMLDSRGGLGKGGRMRAQPNKSLKELKIDISTLHPDLQPPPTSMPKSINDMPDNVLLNILSNLDAPSLASVSQVDRKHYWAAQHPLPSRSIIVNRKLLPPAALMKLVSTGNEDAIVHTCVNSIYGHNDIDILPMINYPILKRIGPILTPYAEGSRKEILLQAMLTRGGKLAELAQILISKNDDVPFIIPHRKNAYKPLPAYRGEGNVDVTMIAITADWLIELSRTIDFRMNIAYVILCMYIYAYVLTSFYVDKTKLQLYAIACFSIVSKISDNYISIDQAADITDNTYTRAQVEAATALVLSIIPPITDIDIPGIPDYMLLPNDRLTIEQRNERPVVIMLSITEGAFQSTFNRQSILLKPRPYFTETYSKIFPIISIPFLVTLSDDKHQLIGSGTYGCVYRPSIPCSTQEVPHDKVGKLSSLNEITDEELMIREINKAIKTSISTPSPSIVHPNPTVCRPKYLPADCESLSAAVQNSPQLMIMPYYGKSLNNKIPKNMTKREFYYRFRNVLLGIHQMNGVGIYHMDIKPSNITIGTDNDPDFHIIDFGMTRTINDINFAEYMNVFRSNYPFWPIETLLLTNLTEGAINDAIAEQRQKILDFISPAWGYTILYRLLNKDARTETMHELYKSITSQGGKVIRRKVTKLKKLIISNIDVWGVGISLLIIMIDNPQLKDDHLIEIIQHVLDPDIYKRYTSKQLLDAYDKFLAEL